jgi:hypothetical protein
MSSCSEGKQQSALILLIKLCTEQELETGLFHLEDVTKETDDDEPKNFNTSTMLISTAAEC